MRVLLVEDDRHLGETLCRGIRNECYACDWVTHADLAIEALASPDFDLVVLDWTLPDGTGIDVLSAMRARGRHIPVLMLTARTAVSDRVGGLDAGADDYLTKPFSLDEFFARLRALLRRRERPLTPEIVIGDAALDKRNLQVRSGGDTITLSKMEFMILEKLAETPGTFVTKGQLVECIYEWDQSATGNAIEAHVSRLRKKLGSALTIGTLRGVGYRVVL